MLDAYIPVLIHVIIAFLIALLVIAITFVFGPKKPTRYKLEPYESGISGVQPVQGRFPVKFLFVAMLFLIFDIETVAFYPWAVLMNQLLLFGLIEMIVFLAILAVAYVYVWKKGAFQWE